MSERSHLEDDCWLTGWLHVVVTDAGGAPRVREEVVVSGCGFV